MNRISFGQRALGLVLLACMAVAGCERPPMDTVQVGYRGTGMEVVVNPRNLAAKVAANQPPAVIPAVPAGGPKASDVYQNLSVLGDLSVAEFTRTMAAITAWVSPEEGCEYCHKDGNFAADNVYTKKVARVMLAMTQRTNQDWQSHVGDTGVTCWTCHRGRPVPEYTWTSDPGAPHKRSLASARQNIAAESVALASLPHDPLTPFLSGDDDIRVVSGSALPAGSEKTIKQTEWTYGLMMHFSDSLGVGCTHCHNSRAFTSWEQSPASRVQAFHAIRHVRELNNTYIGATESYLPDDRRGPLGDPLKVSCKTCHQGAYKPLYGARMLEDYPVLSRLTGTAAEIHRAP